MKRSVTSPHSPSPVGPYSPAVRHGPFVFVSGQVPMIPETGEMLAGSVKEQAERMFENLGLLLTAADASFAEVVKTTVFLTDMADFAELNEVYARYFPAPHPARSTVEVTRLPRGARIEVEAIAITGGGA